MIWVQVIHANWVRDAVNQKFPIPVARYVLDGDFFNSLILRPPWIPPLIPPFWLEDHYSVCNSANFLSSSDSNSDSDSDSDSIRSEQEIASLLADSSSPPAANSTVYLKRDSRKRRTHEFEYVSHRSTSKKSRFADFAQPTAKYEYDDQSGSTLVNPELSSTSTSFVPSPLAPSSTHYAPHPARTKTNPYSTSNAHAQIDSTRMQISGQELSPLSTITIHHLSRYRSRPSSDQSQAPLPTILIRPYSNLGKYTWGKK